MPASANVDRRPGSPGRPLLVLLAVVAGCSPPPGGEPAAPLIHLAERLSPADVDASEPPLPRARPRWSFPEDGAGWSAPGGVVESPGGRALLASPELGIPLASIHSVEVRLRSTPGARLHLTCDGVGGDFESRFAEPGWDPGEDPVYRPRDARLTGTGNVRDFRIMARDLWREDPEAASTTVGRVYLTALHDGPVTIAVERIGVVRREDLRPGPSRALVRETRHGVGMHAVRLAGATEAATRVRLPSGARFRGFLATGGPGSATALEIAVRRDDGEEILLRREVEGNLSEWVPVDLDLSDFGGREIELVFRTEGEPEERWFLGAPCVVGGKWPGRDILVYLIDTMRADVLEPYGYPGRTSPVISRLAREGVLFEECVSVSSWTRPAAASLLTSLSAPAHGVVQETSTLGPDVPTWAEMLRESGYYTVAFFTNPNAGRPSRLDRGFDLAFEITHLVDFARRNDPGAAWGGTPSGTSEGIARRFAAWIDGMEGVPLFLYLHPNDPHTPFRPRAPFDALPGMASPSGRRPVAFARYARDVRVADHFLGEILADLRRGGRLDRTVVAVVSDHGEEFQDHGALGHGVAMWTESLRVPLVIRAPGLPGAGGVHRGRVSLLDVMPTIAELAGLEPVDGLEGRSLVAELERGRTPFAADPVFAHLFTMSVRLDRDLMAEGTFPGDVTVLEDRWKLMLRDYGEHLEGRVTLFDLAADPAERDDLADRDPERAARLSGLARAWYRAVRTGEPEDDEVEIRPETMEQLRALGYLE